MRHYKKMICIIVTLIFSLLISVQSFASEIVFFGTRGEVWKMLKPVEKWAYIQGLYDGLTFAKFKIGDQEIITKTSFEHIISAIDNFYLDYKNELIPVPAAPKIISMEISGKPTLLIENELRELRNTMYRVEKERRRK